MFALVFLLGLTAIATVWGLPSNTARGQTSQSPIAPKVFIIDLFDEEGSSWFGIPEFNVLEQNITVPGFSPLFPQAHCTQDGSICQLVTGEAEINAASTITTLVHSSLFELTRTYFLIAGIAGISPKVGTLGSVTFARYAVQVGLQIEFDAREKPVEFPTGYVPQGAFAPDQFPPVLYGTEVFEVNDDLRQIAIEMAKTGKLADNSPSRQYRANYASNPAFASGAAPPSVIACDTATGDVFWTGNLLGEAFENTTQLFTNGSATYCTTQQEDNATLEALLRGASAGLVDFSRIIIMRTASNFDRPFPGENAATNLFLASPGFDISLLNIPAAGAPIVTGIVSQWSTRFAGGIEPSHYIGDIFGTLGGTPDFGPGSIFEGKPAVWKKRALRRRTSRIVIAD
ncbi:purine nucleoside permease [Trametes coccinea BRFM310]|uniref:Purine nucleoside permease n=1 Tax=Trametes coccinea (strain BRFM310) TaxID=1353009 RepID=A0A1Y2IER3_TRAC3|nr:purine nucleoside permease [Trametes coccinea BRFM310]